VRFTIGRPAGNLANFLPKMGPGPERESGDKVGAGTPQLSRATADSQRESRVASRVINF